MLDCHCTLSSVSRTYPVSRTRIRLYLASERFRLRMRLVCRSWNTVIKTMVLVNHLVSAVSPANYWPSHLGLSRAPCIEFSESFSFIKYNRRAFPSCFCKSRVPKAWSVNLAAISFLQSQERIKAEMKKDFLIDVGRIDGIMVLIRG